MISELTASVFDDDIIEQQDFPLSRDTIEEEEFDEDCESVNGEEESLSPHQVIATIEKGQQRRWSSGSSPTEHSINSNESMNARLPRRVASSVEDDSLNARIPRRLASNVEDDDDLEEMNQSFDRMSSTNSASIDSPMRLPRRTMSPSWNLLSAKVLDLQRHQC